MVPELVAQGFQLVTVSELLQYVEGQQFRPTSLEAELGEFMAKLYKRYVPSQTREYIESMDDPEDRSRPRPNRITKSTGPDADEEGK